MSEKIRVYRLKILMTEKWQVVMLISLFWAGMIIGCIYINGDNGYAIDEVKNLVTSTLTSRGTFTGYQLFKNAVFKYGVFLFLAFFFGMSGVGYPFVCAVPLISGISNGLITGYLYGNFGVSGFLYCIATMYPALILALTSLIMGAHEGLEMSVSMMKILADKNRISQENILKKYGYQFFILFSIIIASAVLETILCHFFLTKFNLF